ncbi:MAG: zinc ribbon domain-containing protein [Ruminococcaceae bacterium]|nr:zinc ribbon domain-containing protein [Oscillospiraceae bacterium]
MKCPNCQTDIPNGAKFCGKCGISIQQESVKPEPVKEEPVLIEAPVPAKIKKPFCFAAFLFFLYPLFNISYSFILSFYRNILNGNVNLTGIKSWFINYFFNKYDILGTALMYIEFFLFIAIAVMLFVKHSGFGLTAGIFLLMIPNIIYLIRYIIDYLTSSRSFNYMAFQGLWFFTVIGLYITTILCLGLLMILTIPVALKRPRSKLMILSFAPGLIFCLYTVFYTIVRIFYYSKNHFGASGMFWLPIFLEALAYLGLGIWIYRVSGKYGIANKKE